MNQIDLEILYFFNQYAGKNALLDHTIEFISINHIFKGGVFVLLVWFLWFKKGEKKVYRPLIILNLIGCFIAMFIARIMAKVLPFRFRPIHDPSLDVSMPLGFDETYAEGLSSFPSDHAALFFALATGIYFLNKKLGIIALFYAFLVICLPRVFLGLHFPTDIMAGAFIGTSIVIMVHKINFFTNLNSLMFDFKRGYPSVFYALFFLITYQIADMFESVRAIMKFSYYIFLGGDLEL